MTARPRWTAGIQAACLALAAMLLATSTVLAVEAGPDNPRRHYWLRNTGARVVEPGPMDARLRELADAFGQGEHERTRRLAQALFDSTGDAALRAEAASFLVQSHLAEGDSDAARAAAERVNDQESLARINRIEADYEAEVDRLQQIVATTTQPGQAAHAQVLIARAHERVGRADLALDSYANVIGRYPEDMRAGHALVQMTRIYAQQRRTEDSLVLAQHAIDAYPDSASLTRVAVQLLVNVYTSRKDYETAKSCVQQIVTDHPGTEAGGQANLALGELWVARGSPERAEKVWAALLRESAYERTAAFPTVVEKLALLRLDLAKRAREEGRVSDAVALLELVLNNLHPDTVCYRAHMEFARGCEELGRYDEALAAYQKLQTLAADENTNLWMRYHEAAVLQRAGRQQESAEIFRSVLAQEPGDSRLMAACLAGLAFCDMGEAKP